MSTQPSTDQPRTDQHSARRRVLTAAAAVTICAGLVGVNLAQQAPLAAAAARLTAFGDCEELADWHRTNADTEINAWGLRSAVPAMEFGFRGEIDVSADTSAPLSGTAANAVGPGATGTNLQEAGVDEPDTVKTNGSQLFTVEGDRLVVTQIDGDNPVKRGEVQLPWLTEHTSADDGLPVGARASSELLLAGDRVLVFSVGQLAADRPAADTQVAVVDVADPRSPRVLSSQRVTGRYLTGRLHDGRVRLALSAAPDPGFVTPGGAWTREDAVAHNRDVWAKATGEDFLPTVTAADGSATPLVDCSAVHHPTDYAGSETLSVLTIDPQATEPIVDTVAITASGGAVYASEDRLYVATNGAWTSPNSDIEPAPGWGGRWGGRWGGEATDLHGFDISGPDATTYLASGEVRGWLLSQWAMSARDGYLRVATTRPPEGSAPTPEPGEPIEVQAQQDSAVTVFREIPGASGEPGSLEVVGEVTGLGKTETIRAVRWFEDTAVVVTFRQTDPLYLIDLSDPTSPRVTGELKIPGYSAYLHPVGDGMLLGVGQDATESGRVLGAQVSTFDVSDLSRPRRLEVLTEPGSRAAVESNSRVFAYLPTRRVAVVQVWGRNGGAALRAVRVAADGQLAQVGSYTGQGGESAIDQPGLMPPGERMLVERAIPVSGDRLAAIMRNPRTSDRSVVLLQLDELAASSPSAL